MHNLKKVQIADDATVVGKRDIGVRMRQNRFARPRFFFYQAVWLAAAMLVGWLGMVLFRSFFQTSTQAVGSGWRSLGLGFAVLVGAHVAIILIAITLIGLPVSLMLLAMYLPAVCVAKLSGSIPRANACEAGRSNQGRLASGTACGTVDPHHCQVNSVSWRGVITCRIADKQESTWYVIPIERPSAATSARNPFFFLLTSDSEFPEACELKIRV